MQVAFKISHRVFPGGNPIELVFCDLHVLRREIFPPGQVNWPQMITDVSKLGSPQ